MDWARELSSTIDSNYCSYRNLLFLTHNTFREGRGFQSLKRIFYENESRSMKMLYNL